MSGGEQSIKTGNHGEKMMKEFLRLVGWESISQNETFVCSSGKKHKLSGSKSDKEHHNIDGTFYYDNPLNHSETDVILCSSKHNQDKYSDKNKAVSHLKELAFSLECAPQDVNFSNSFENSGKKKSFKGVLFWVSSNEEEQNVNMIEQISDNLIRDAEEDETISPRLRGINFDSIYLIDNRKATFILSAINTANKFHPESKVRFLFPHTGLNNQTEDIMTYGDTLPVQYINSSLLPIVIDEGDKVSVLLFCDSDFNNQYLKRLIWFAHKVSGLVGDISIIFNNYDATIHEADVNRVKSSFEHSSLTSKISVKKLRYYDFITLKEDSQPNRILSKGPLNPRIKREIFEPSNGSSKEQDLDRILPFGEMIKPIIASTILSETDIKAFLIRRGIYIGNKEKQSTVPLLSTLLLSPEELDILKYLLKDKEDKIKSVPRNTSLGENIPSVNSLSSLINNSVVESLDKVNLPANCVFHRRPTISLVKDEVMVSFTLEKHNSTKDLITGKQHNEGNITFRLGEGSLDSQINYTSREVYSYATKLFKKIETSLIDQRIIDNEFLSIRFDSFSNQGRINFFMRFLSTIDEPVFNNAQLEHIVVRPDESLEEELPFDLESLKKKVNQLAISGRALDSVHYFQDNYKKALLMQRVKIKYEYRIDGESGKCLVDLDFKNALSGNIDSELHLNLEIQKNRSTKGRNLDKLKSSLRNAFNKTIQNKYKATMNVTKPPQT